MYDLAAFVQDPETKKYNYASLDTNLSGIGTYDSENRIYYGSRFDDTVYTKTGGGKGDVIHTYGGNDYIHTWGRSDSVYAGDGNDTIIGNTACHVLDGGAGNDEIRIQEAGTNTQGFIKVSGGRGNDTILGSDWGKAVFEFNKGDGQDTINSRSNEDIIKFNDMLLSDLEVVQKGADIEIHYGISDKITLKDAYDKLKTIILQDKNGTEIPVLRRLSIVTGSGEIIGDNTSEKIYGSAAADTITGNKGNDTIDALGGDDIFVFNNGDGNDTILQGVNADVDSLKFNDSDLSELDFSKGEDNDLVILYNRNADSVTVKDYFTVTNTVKKWIDKNGNSYDIDTVNRHIINSSEADVQGTVFNDYITVNSTNVNIDGKEGANTYVIDPKGTYNITSTSGKDIIKFANLSVTDLTFEVSGDDVTIKNADSSLNITIKNYMINLPEIKIQDTTGTETKLLENLAGAGLIYSDEPNIIGRPEADKIFGGDSANIIDGKGGSDTINGGKGNDTIVLKKGYGATVVLNGTEVDETDTLKFEDSVLEDLYYKFNGNDMVIEYNNGADSVTIKNYKLTGNTVKNLITRNPENTEDANYLISDIKNTITGTSSIITGTDYNDKIYGTDGDDTISGGKGNNILIGGKGNDTYVFENGGGISDSRNDVIIDTVGDDTIQIDENPGASSEVIYKNDGKDLVIWYNKDTSSSLDLTGLSYGINDYGDNKIYVESNAAYCSSITVKDYFKTDTPSVDTIKIGSESYLISKKFNNYADLEGIFGVGTYDSENRIYHGSRFDYTVYTKTGGGKGDDVYTYGGNDYIYTWGRSDNVYAGDGNDTIVAHSSSLVLDGGAGNDKISIHRASSINTVKVFGGQGDDTITSNDCPAYIYTNSETGGKDSTAVDVINVYSSDATIYAQSKSNLITCSGNYKNNYYAYIDQYTYIKDSAGEDSLTLTNTEGTTDGAKENLHVLFNVNSNNSYSEVSEIGNVIITDSATKENYEKGMSGLPLSGILIENNQIETIKSSDNYTLSSTDILTLAQTVASWLVSDGRSYSDVSAVFEENNSTDIAALISVFDNANWQHTA